MSDSDTIMVQVRLGRDFLRRMDRVCANRSWSRRDLLEYLLLLALPSLEAQAPSPYGSPDHPLDALGTTEDH